MSRRVDLVSPLPLAECIGRLRGEIDRPWALRGKRPVRGWIVGGRLRVRVRQGAMVRNPFQTILGARLDAVPGGTHLRCRFDIGTLPAVLMGVWLGGAVLAGVVLFATGIAAFSAERAGAQALAFVVGPPALLVAGLAVIAAGRWLARDEQRVLIEFLERTVAARVTTAQMLPKII